MNWLLTIDSQSCARHGISIMLTQVARFDRQSIIYLSKSLTNKFNKRLFTSRQDFKTPIGIGM